MKNSHCQLLSEIRSNFSSSGSPTSHFSLKKSSSPPEDEDFTSNLSNFDQFEVISILSNSKFPLYIARSMRYQQNVCIKVFPRSKKYLSSSFINESRFILLNHPNVVKMFDSLDNHSFSPDADHTISASLLIMELAICDFRRIITHPYFMKNEKWARTYFHQLVQGIEYLHCQNVTHLDLKPDNLLLGQDFKLKITDFDLSFHKEDVLVIGRGTKHYRSPELIENTCKKPQLADIYSLGIILFVFVTGSLPYFESRKVHGYDLYQLVLDDDKSQFWAATSTMHSRNIFSKDFKDLFNMLVVKDPKGRPSIEEIKKSNWYRGPTFSDEELKSYMKMHFSEVINASKSFH